MGKKNKDGFTSKSVRQKKAGGVYYYEFMREGQRYNGTCIGCRTKPQAEKYLIDIIKTMDEAGKLKTVKALVENYRDVLAGTVPIPLADAFERYMAKPSRRTPKECQIARNRTYWNDFVAFMADKHPDIEKMGSVTKGHAEEYITMLRTSGVFMKKISFQRHGKEHMYTPKNNQLSPRTINGRHKAIKAVFSRLQEDTGMLTNPFDIPTLDNNTVSRDVFSEEEIKKIIESMTMPYIKPIFTIGFCTGLTLGDICLLKWSEISSGCICKKRNKTGVSLEIPILPPLASFLLQQSQQGLPTEYISPELAEMYQKNDSGVIRRIRRFLEGIGIVTTVETDSRRRKVSIKGAHAIRHTFAYIAGVCGIPINIVQSILGHMSPEITALYQRHADRKAKEQCMKMLPNFFGDTENGTVASAPALPLSSSSSEPVSAAREELKRLIDILPEEEVLQLLEELREPEGCCPPELENRVHGV